MFVFCFIIYVLQMGGMHPGANNGMMGTSTQSQHAHQYMNGNGPSGMNPAAMGPMSAGNGGSGGIANTANMQMNQMGGANGNMNTTAGQMTGMPGYNGGIGGPATASVRHHQVSTDYIVFSFYKNSYFFLNLFHKCVILVHHNQ